MTLDKGFITVLLISFFMIFSNTASAYGGGGGSSTCKKPKFKKFTPPASSVVSPKSEFSFVASADVRKSSINVAVKKENVKVKISEQLNGRFLVTGNLPDSLMGTYAKITIVAETGSKCKGREAWLLKITEE